MDALVENKKKQFVMINKNHHKCFFNSYKIQMLLIAKFKIIYFCPFFGVSRFFHRFENRNTV